MGIEGGERSPAIPGRGGAPGFAHGREEGRRCWWWVVWDEERRLLPVRMSFEIIRVWHEITFWDGRGRKWRRRGQLIDIDDWYGRDERL